MSWASVTESFVHTCKRNCTMAFTFTGAIVLNSLLGVFSQRCIDFGSHGPNPLVVPRNTSANIDDSVTFQCEGDFGCGDSALREVVWLAGGPGSSEYIEIGSNERTSSYITDTYKSTNGAIMGATLTVPRVQEEDYKMKFYCIMASARAINGFRTFTVQIQPNHFEYL